MHPRIAGPLAILAAGLILGLGTPTAQADRLPTNQPKELPFDSDPEVPNQTWMGPVTADVSQAEDLRIARRAQQHSWLSQLRRWALSFFARVGGGVPR